MCICLCITCIGGPRLLWQGGDSKQSTRNSEKHNNIFLGPARSLCILMMQVAVYEFISSLETEYKLQLSVSAVSSLANYEYLNLVHNSISSEYLCLRYCLFLVPGAAPRDRSYGSSMQQTRTCDLQIDSILTSILHQSSKTANLYLYLVESASTTFTL